MRRQAVKNAKDKAELLASELGATLSGVQSIQDTTAEALWLSGRSGMDPFGGPAPAPPLAVGEIQITASVKVVFQMSDTDFD